MKTETDYWFTIEPYVYVGVNSNNAFLYNTLDGVTLKTKNSEVIKLIQETLEKKNCGVVLLKHNRYKKNIINRFINELREKYMGDIIDVNLSKKKPVQLLPFFNLTNNQQLYKKHNFSQFKNVLDNLSEISIHVNYNSDTFKLITFLQSLPERLIFNIIGIIEDDNNHKLLLTFLNQNLSHKNVLCSYQKIINLQPDFENNFSYKISVQFPIDIQKWNNAMKLLLGQSLPYQYVFDVFSKENCIQAEQLVEKHKIENYQLRPVFTGKNMLFFEENVFYNEEDILSSLITIKDIFTNQAMNIYDFGKINILPNGDVYANLKYPSLGNIYIDSIYDILQKEIEEGKSWFNIRNHAPCNNCVYQWLCPPPCNYEVEIDRYNLCHIKK